MWVAVYNYGLYRSDGYDLQYYRHDPKDSTSLASNAISTVYADKNGIIWVGTQERGLDRLDPNSGIVTHFRHKVNDSTSLSDDRVITILEDRDGAIWVGTKNGLNRLEQKTKVFTHYFNDPGDSTSLSDNQVQVLYQDRKGTLWVGTGRGHYQRESTDKGKGGLNRFNKKTKKFSRYLHEPEDSHSLIDNWIGAIFEDSHGTFWVSTAGDGLHIMNREKGIFDRLRYDATHPETLSGPPRKKRIGLDMDLFFIQEDGAGAIWVGASGGWITRYDPKTKKATHFDSFNGDAQDMDAVSGAFTSSEGILWITTWRGSIYQVDPFQTIIHHFNVGSIVHGIYEEASGAIWLGTFNNGLIRHDRNSGSIKRFSAGAAGPATLKDVSVESIYEEDDNTLWIGGEKGLYRYNRKTQTFTPYIHDPKNENSLSKGHVYDILEDKPGFLWIATRNGLDLFDIRNGIFKHYKNDPKNSSSLSHNEVFSILKDHSGNLWIGTHGGILNLFDSLAGKFKRFPCGSGEITSIVEDFERIIWVRTSDGLYRSNIARDSFSRFTHPRIATAMVTCILEDSQRNLWFGSTAGIIRLNSSRNAMTIYSKEHGVDASSLAFYLMRGAKGRRGEFYFADNSGYYTFFPEQFQTNPTPPQIDIRDFRLADQLVKPGKGSPLSLPMSQTKVINLDYYQNDFSFEFIGIHFSSPEDNQYLFMLENLEKNWRKAGTEKSAYYYNVRPGKYIFRVKAANSNDIWAEKTVIILISPPWWTNWWFRIGLIFFVAVLFYVLIRWRLHQKFRRQLERSEKEKQFAELQQQKIELEMQALRAQMNPHFIFNSLNSINMFILENNKLQASEYLSKFSRLVRSILQHSQEAFIPLDRELEALRLYLELESLRFEQRFEYKISVNNEVDTTMVKVPPLIIQPYAENAIWHGLMHKKEKGHLEIELYIKEKILFCKITDDGIGRKRAAELKTKSSLTYKSMGMRITADRIAIMQQQEQNNTFISVNDLVLPDGRSAGTEVLIKVPVTYD
jgi:ligand-binding sensor domain-containing protein